MIRYRQEIDGLRAVAVLAVLFFHIEIPLFKGGFVGVDIFFVISGYLITKLIITGIDTGKFSLLRFYEKRAKRLLPTLFLMIIIISVFNFFLIDYLTFKNFGKEIIATVFYFSNIFFWREVGYFDSLPIQKTLLHTWSLSLEEQFYFCFPILILIINRFKNYYNKITSCLIIILLVSFISNLYFIKIFPSATFYLLPTRAWEFLCGSLVVLISNKYRCKSINVSNIIFTIGFVLLFTPIFFFSKIIAYPGAAATLPVLGTMFMIFSGDTSNFFLIKLLKSKIICMIGRMSYSLYIWHWPIYVLYKYIVMHELKFIDQIILTIICFFFTFLSWKFVEQPFRYYKTKSNKLFLIITLLFPLSISALGLAIYKNNGFPKRNKSNNIMLQALHDPFWDTLSKNEANFLHQQFQSPFFVGDTLKKPSYILWGDSHARAIAYGLNYFSKNNNLSGYVFTMSSTPPIIDIYNVNNSNMLYHNNSVMTFIKKNTEIKNVLLCAKWSYYLKESYNNDEFSNRPIFSSMKNSENFIRNNENRNLFFLGLTKTIDTLCKYRKKVFIITPVPEISFDVRNLIGNHFFLRLNNKSINNYSQSYSEYKIQNETFNDFIKTISKNKNVVILRSEKFFFSNPNQMIIKSNHLLYRDRHHLSKYGSLYISNIFKPLLYN